MTDILWSSKKGYDLVANVQSQQPVPAPTMPAFPFAKSEAKLSLSEQVLETVRNTFDRLRGRPDEDGKRDLGCKVLIVIVVLVALLVLAAVLGIRPGNPTGPFPGPSGPLRWIVCGAPGGCDTPELQRWAVHPRDLAATVVDFSAMPGLPQEAYQPVADHWQLSPPVFHGAPVQLADIAEFVRDVLSSDPFGTDDSVPFVNLRPPGEGKVVAISQRQLAFLVANAFMGNTIPSGDGLSALIRRCSSRHSTGFLYSLLSFLAVLSQELGPGEQGKMLFGATPKAQDDTWRHRLASRQLPEPTVCERQPDGHFSCNLADFMSGGTAYQGLVDIAGGVVGGGAQLCDLASSQDESLVQFYSEVLAFSFFTTMAGDATPMLPVPFTLLGARRYVRDITGQTGIGAQCGSIHPQNWLNEEILTESTVVPIATAEAVVAASAFVAVASVCTACTTGTSCSMGDFINNQCDQQRRHLDEDLARWYQAFEPTMYHEYVQQAFGNVVKRIGTGPWGAGVWYGDGQQFFLAVWLATSLLSGASLDYYLYDHFCENPGNQCFLLGANGCTACIARSQAEHLDPAQCGKHSYRDMVERFRGMPSQALYAALKTVGTPPDQVFDLLATA